MTPKEALNNIATISEILVEVSKSHIMSNKAINEIRKLDIAEIYFTLRQALAELNELKHDVAIFKDTLNSIKAICNEPSPSWILSLAEISERYTKIDNLINTYDDEKLSKVGKEE